MKCRLYIIKYHIMMDAYEESKKNTKRYKKLRKLLKVVYNFDSFKPKQYEIINRIISGEDVCAVLPTGYGKSLTYQIPAIYLNKTAVIISPLISLMDDQQMALKELGLSSCCYNGTVSNKSDMKKDILQGQYQFVYITPESFISLQDFFVKLEDMQGISLVAIDEAHCISSYGFDFRKSFRELSIVKTILPKVPVLAVTATATKLVGEDICRVLKMTNTEPIKTSFNRTNLHLEIRRKSTSKECTNPIARDIVPIVKEHSAESVIVYCLTIKETEKIALVLQAYGVSVGIYNSKVTQEEKAKTHKKFLNGKITCVCATIAFGMGINKANVRAVIHYGAPKNIEGYYQEIGRAGRDGKEAYCYMFYNMKDFVVNEQFILNGTNEAHRKLQLKLLGTMKQFILTEQCRRKILLDYFDEDTDDLVCNKYCDNCAGTHNRHVTTLSTKQNVHVEAKMLIDLIESIPAHSYGIKMYVNILRGSAERNITMPLRKNKFYNKGSNKSFAWWKELCEKLISLGYIRQDCVRGRFMMQILKVTKKGIMWASMAGLEAFGVEKLEPIEMVADS